MKKKSSFSEILLSHLKSTFFAFLPVFNTLNAGYLLGKGLDDDMYNDLLNKSFKEGIIRKASSDDVVVSVSSRVKDKSKNDDVSYSKNCKSYNDMTVQEKLKFLENERNSALDEIDQLMQDRGFSRSRNDKNKFY